MLDYQSRSARLTLAQGLAEYFAQNPGLKRPADLTAPAREFFRCHDAVHVIYGCGTSLTDEAIVKIASLFGTDGGRAVMDGYRLYDSMDIYRQLRVGEILKTIAVAPYIVPRTIMRCRAQRKPWPWSAHHHHLETPLDELRRTYAIRVLKTVGGSKPEQLAPIA